MVMTMMMMMMMMTNGDGDDDDAHSAGGTDETSWGRPQNFPGEPAARRTPTDNVS